MAEYINREAAIRALLNDAPEQVSYSREDAADCIRYMDAADVAPVVHGKRLLADMSGAKAVSLHDIYRVIAGHSYYHGDRILAALTCIVEGKEVNPVRPADVAPVVHGRWIEYQIPHVICCSNCDWATDAAEKNFQYCPMCGARMDGDRNALD